MGMILQTKERRTCRWGCCGDTAHGKQKVPTRRRLKRRERQAWQRESRV